METYKDISLELTHKDEILLSISSATITDVAIYGCVKSYCDNVSRFAIYDMVANALTLGRGTASGITPDGIVEQYMLVIEKD